MPNHISNIVTIKGNELQAIIDKIKGDETALSFESFCPSPKDQDSLDASGLPSWYTWNVANWGTKWDAYEVSSVLQDENSIKISFQTAWATPVAALVKLSSLYPNIEILCEYADEDMGYNMGEYVMKNGDVIRMTAPEFGTQEAIDLAKKIWYNAEELNS